MKNKYLLIFLYFQPYMLHYKLNYAIPTESNSNGLCIFEKSLYFASGTFIYKYIDNKYTIFALLKSQIKNFFVQKNIAYVITEDSLVLVYNKKNIASLSKKCECLLVTDKYIVVGVENILEIWNIPHEYKFGMFDLYDRDSGHANTITCLCLYENLIISGGIDCSIRCYSLSLKKSFKILNTRSKPIGIHLISQSVYVVCDEGQIYELVKTVNDQFEIFFSIKNKIFKNSSLTCSSSYKNSLIITKTDNDKSIIEIIKENEVIYTLNSDKKISEIFLYKYNFAMKNNNYLSWFDFEKDIYIFEYDLIKISCMDIKNDLIAIGCTDKKIRILNNNNLMNTLYDEKNLAPLYKVFFFNNSILSISINGYISMFDIKNEVCFRSFNISVKISATDICNDGMMIFIADADTYKIRIIDLQRSREIDSLVGHMAPVKCIKYDNGFLFSLSLDNELKRWNIFKPECISINLEKTAIYFVLRYNLIYILLMNEILIYNKDLEYTNSVLHKTQSDFLDVSYDGKLIFLGGETNKIYIFDCESVLLQTLKTSRNLKEKHKVLSILHSNNKDMVYILTTEGVFIHKFEVTKYLPISLDIETTTEAVKTYLKEKNYLNAIIAILKMRDINLFASFLKIVPEENIEALVRYIPENMSDILRLYLVNNMNEGYYVFKWMRYMILYHGKGQYDKNICLKNGEKSYQTTLENLYMLENLLDLE